MRRACGGGFEPMASSTATTEATECTPVHTPQMRPTKAHTSRGSRPRQISSMPRNMVVSLHASEIFPFSCSNSMRR